MNMQAQILDGAHAVLAEVTEEMIASAEAQYHAAIKVHQELAANPQGASVDEVNQQMERFSEIAQEAEATLAIAKAVRADALRTIKNAGETSSTARYRKSQIINTTERAAP